MAQKLSKEITFEKALTELEEITMKLEEGRESLENSMSLYEKGVELKKLCESQLKKAEGKWQILRKASNGTVTPEEIANDKIPEPNDLSHVQDNLF